MKLITYLVLFTFAALPVFANNFECDKVTENGSSSLQNSLNLVTSYSFYGNMKEETLKVSNKKYNDAGNEVYQFSAEHYESHITDVVLEFVLNPKLCPFVAESEAIVGDRLPFVEGRVLKGTYKRYYENAVDLSGKILYKYEGGGH